MSKVKVYRFRMYNISSDENVVSTRMATAAYIELIGAELLQGTDTEIESSLLMEGEGYTKKNFNPNLNI